MALVALHLAAPFAFLPSINMSSISRIIGPLTIEHSYCRLVSWWIYLHGLVQYFVRGHNVAPSRRSVWLGILDSLTAVLPAAKSSRLRWSQGEASYPWHCCPGTLLSLASCQPRDLDSYRDSVDRLWCSIILIGALAQSIDDPSLDVPSIDPFRVY